MKLMRRNLFPGGTGVPPVELGVAPNSVRARGLSQDLSKTAGANFKFYIVLQSQLLPPASTDSGETPESTGGTPVPPFSK